MATTALDLFRQVRKEDFPDGTMADEDTPTTGVLYPDFYEKEIGPGRVRQPDVEMVQDDEGHEWVRAGGGTSLFDVRGIFKGKSWLSFTIPQGTEIPDSLVIRRTHYSDKFQATHYQIEARARMMRKDAFQGALDNLARNAIVRAVELG